MNNNIVNSPVPELERHQRKCAVCRHPEREAIEEAFLHWHSPNQIASDHDLEEASIYRHAHAIGLFDRRDNNLRFVLANFMERVNEIQVVTPAAIVRALRAYGCISKTGQWIEPPRQVTITFAKAPEACASQVPVQVAGHVRAAEPRPAEVDTSPKAIKALQARLRDVASGRVKRLK